MAQPQRTEGGDRTKNIVKGIDWLSIQGVLGLSSAWSSWVFTAYHRLLERGS